MAKLLDPAPVPSGRPSIKQLAEAMRMEDFDISTQWRDLGLELVDSNKILRVIEANNRNDVNTCCRVMFEKWLEMTPDASWNQLIIALITIKMNTAANAISKLLKSENVKGEEDHVVSGESDYNFAVPIEDTTNLSSISFSDCDNIQKAFLRLTAEVSKLLKKVDFCTLRRAIVEQRKVPPSGVQFPADLYERIKKAQDLDALLDVLADSDYWSWVDLRLLEALIMSSGIKEAEVLVNKYKDAIFPKKLSDIIHELFVPQQKKKKCEEAYIAKVGTKIHKKPSEVTVGDLPKYRGVLEKVIMDIYNGSCVLKHLKRGCLEIHWVIPIHCRLHAYKSALNNRHKFCDIHLQYLHIEPYQPIYNPFTIPPTMMATLLHLSKPIASTSAEVIDHYYYFLADNVDNNLMQQTMHELKVVSEKDITDSTTMCNEYQKNAFLLDHLLVASTDSILAFCHSLQAKNEQLGHMLMNAIKSIPADGTGASQSSSTPYQLTCSEEYDQPQVFLAAKTVHLRFLNLITKLSQKLKIYDSKTFLAACDKLTENDSHLKAIPLLASNHADDLDNSGTDEIFMRFSFMWTWINHSFLRALLEACGCQDGIIMLDEFESQIDTNQPIELYPIPPPSMKMAPSLSSAYTILSIRSEQYTDDSPPLQYVNEVALIMTEKFGVSSYTFQLLAARNNPVMLYWMILRRIVPIINDGVKKCLNFLKQRKFSEFAIYPNTILYTTDNLNHGSFAFLSSQPQDVWCRVENFKLDLPPVNMRVKDLEKIVNTLQSELAVKSAEMDKLKDESKSSTVLSKHLSRDDSTVASQTTVKQNPEDMYDIKNLKADLPLTMDMRVKELESTVEELQSELTVKSTEMDRLKNESKLLVAKFCQSKYQSNVNEDNSAQSSESTIVDTLKQDLEILKLAVLSFKTKEGIIKI